MKKSPLCCYLFCAAMSASSAALAATAPVSAGVIHFKGQIVEYGCNLGSRREEFRQAAISLSKTPPACILYFSLIRILQ